LGHKFKVFFSKIIIEPFFQPSFLSRLIPNNLCSLVTIFTTSEDTNTNLTKITELLEIKLSKKSQKVEIF